DVVVVLVEIDLPRVAGERAHVEVGIESELRSRVDADRPAGAGGEGGVALRGGAQLRPNGDGAGDGRIGAEVHLAAVAARGAVDRDADAPGAPHDYQRTVARLDTDEPPVASHAADATRPAGRVEDPLDVDRAAADADRAAAAPGERGPDGLHVRADVEGDALRALEVECAALEAPRGGDRRGRRREGEARRGRQAQRAADAAATAVERDRHPDRDRVAARRDVDRAAGATRIRRLGGDQAPLTAAQLDRTVGVDRERRAVAAGEIDTAAVGEAEPRHTGAAEHAAGCRRDRDDAAPAGGAQPPRQVDAPGLDGDHVRAGGDLPAE